MCQGLAWCETDCKHERRTTTAIVDYLLPYKWTAEIAGVCTVKFYQVRNAVKAVPVLPALALGGHAPLTTPT